MITIGVIFGILGNIRQDIKTLVAAVTFILSGKISVKKGDLPYLPCVYRQTYIS